jgi:formylglycine-generating enzyme required for sulfatase activity
LRADPSPSPNDPRPLLFRVWEWCSDWFEEYHVGAVVNPRGPDEATRRVIRGGSWRLDAWNWRAACRGGGPQIRGGNLGFRVARGPSG